MPLDLYDPCPCGSGRKLKFCCRDLSHDMERVLKFQENNQPRMALNALDDLGRKHPENTWVRTTRGGLLFDAGDLEGAHRELSVVVANDPEHGFALALVAMIQLSELGYSGAREEIERALRRCVTVRPDMAANLALGISAWMRLHGELMASRQHLVLSLQLASSAEQQESIFRRLAEFDGTREIPYPFRSVYVLDEVGGDAAAAVAGCGCWGEAADRYGLLLDELEDESGERFGLCFNRGLCLVWSGQSSAASEAMVEAAGMAADADRAEECQALAQLLIQGQGDDVVKMVDRRFGIENVSKWLTDLDASERFIRVDEPGRSEEGGPVGMYHLVEGEIVAAAAADSLTLETVPRVVARLMVQAAGDEEPAAIDLVARSGEEIDAAEAALREVSGELSHFEGEDGVEGDESVDLVPREFAALYTTWHFEPKTLETVKRRLHREFVEKFVSEIWPATELAALDGQSPEAAAGDAERSAALAGAVRVLEVRCEQNMLSIDVPSIRQAMGLPEGASVAVESDDELAILSTCDLLRVDPASLDDQYLVMLLNRALLVRHSGLLFRVLTEYTGRESLQGGEEFLRAAVALADLCELRHDRESALLWLSRARQSVMGLEGEFERTLQLEMRELTLRLSDPADPGLRDLLSRLWTDYGSKLPELRVELQSLVEAVDIEAPWSTDGGSVTASGLWTPGDPVQSVSTPEAGGTDGAGGADGGAGDKTLWLPGQAKQD
jgi:hypothetical protein